MNDEVLARTAIHEAAHAVMAKALGVLVTGAAITSERSGWCRTSRADPNENLLVSLAGCEAERLLFGAAIANEAQRDLQHVEQLEQRYGLSPSVVAAARAQVRDVLKQNWDKVERVAEQLVRRRYLPGTLITAYSFGTLESMWRRAQRPRRLRDRRTAA
jgi:hypothetical protein